jgi:hypothetical protein
LRYKLLRAILPVLCLSACAAAPSGAGAVTVGISDSSPAMFSNSLFNALKLHQARLLVDWNAAVMPNHAALNAAGAWIQAAQAAGVSPLVDFTADPGTAGNFIPSVKE